MCSIILQNLLGIRKTIILGMLIEIQELLEVSLSMDISLFWSGSPPTPCNYRYNQNSYILICKFLQRRRFFYIEEGWPVVLMCAA
jgi:hypothetical protein